MSKINCWQFKQYGRELGGRNVDEFGVCPAATETCLDGINEGENGGRCCWAVVGSGTAMHPVNPCPELLKFLNCMHCDFFEVVVRSEGHQYAGMKEIQNRLKILKKR